MKTLFILGLAALASARNIKVDQLEYGFCDGSAETITLSVQLTLNEPIPVGAQVSLKIKKEGLIDVPFPCLEIDGLHIGSCDYDGDHLLELGAEALCPTYFPDGQECALPLNPGTYGGDPPIVLTLPEIPAIIAELLASGTYYAEATISLADGTQMACLFVRVEVTAH